MVELKNAMTISTVPSLVKSTKTGGFIIPGRFDKVVFIFASPNTIYIYNREESSSVPYFALKLYNQQPLVCN